MNDHTPSSDPVPDHGPATALPASRPPTGAAYLLSALGARSAAVFAEQVGRLGMTPPLVGLLRAIARGPGRSQRAIAAELGIRPSRLVALLDELDGAGLIERRPHPNDRRQHALHVSASGRRLLDRQLAEAATAHEDELLAALAPGERRQLAELLRRVAEQQGLAPEVHPGYRRL